MTEKMRQFDSGATRSSDADKFDYEGFLSPLVLERYAAYMHENRLQADGKLRASDNWQKGMGLPVYMKSLWRHFMALWKNHRGIADQEDIETSLCALMFNTMGYLHDHLTSEATKVVPPVRDAGTLLRGEDILKRPVHLCQCGRAFCTRCHPSGDKVADALESSKKWHAAWDEAYGGRQLLTQDAWDALMRS